MISSPLPRALVLAAVLAGCASPDAPEATPAEPAAPPAGTAVPAADGGVVALEAALREALGPDAGEARYVAGRADLDGDGRAEAVAHVAGPLLCGTGGCPTLVFTPEGDGLRLVTQTTVSRPPVVALAGRTKGWRDLAVGVGGGGAEAGLARLRFDGEAYPDNPTAPPAEPVAEARGDTLVAPFESFTDGTPLSP